MIGWHFDGRIVSFLEFLLCLFWSMDEDFREFLKVFDVEGLVEGKIKSHFVHIYGFVVFSSVLLPYLWIYSFCCWYILRFSRIYVRSSSVFIIHTICLFSLVCSCFVVVYLLFILFTRPLFSLFS